MACMGQSFHETLSEKEVKGGECSEKFIQIFAKQIKMIVVFQADWL